MQAVEVTLVPPTLDEVLDVLRVCSRGKALGPDAVPVELVIAGGLIAARLVHALISGCWLQREAPLSWKGGHLFHIRKPGGKQYDCEGQRGATINDHLSSINGKLLRPSLLAIELASVPFSQAVGSARRGATLAAHCSWALFSSAAANGRSAGALFSYVLSAYYNVIR